MRENQRFLSWVAFLLLILPIAGAGAEEATVPGPPKTSGRLIVELDEEPVISTLKGKSPSELHSTAALERAAQIRSSQEKALAKLQRDIPGLALGKFRNEKGEERESRFQVAMNAIVVHAEKGADVEKVRRKLEKSEGVKRVYLDYARYPTTFSSTTLINAPAAWSNASVGGQSNAGAGVKVASIDGGAHHAAPMFDGTGYAYPPGFPKGDVANTNGKIIVSRAYFRATDPPVAGDENTWPGEWGTSHGVHTASTAAGNAVTGSFRGVEFALTGVAPRAWVMSYRVFYAAQSGDTSFYDAEGIAAIEDMILDGADVVNNSWGGGPGSSGGEFDALDAALIRASDAGIFVVMSNGNAGPGPATGDHPSAAYINVAATTKATVAAAKNVIDITGPAPVDAANTGFPMSPGAFGGTLPLTFSGNFKTSTAVNPANVDGCSAWPADSFAGKIAVIRRGTCEFGVKALNAQQAGATGVVIYNQVANGETLLAMGAGAVGAGVTIPAVLTGNAGGTKLVDWYTTQTDASTLVIDSTGKTATSTADVVASFSSRGPGVGNTLKPDIAAPGVDVLAQGYTLYATGEARHLGFGLASGTSMAAPHVAGAGALLRQIHPTWTNMQVKSALMTTAKYLEVYNSGGTPAQPLDVGAGRLDLTRAADPKFFLDPPSLGFGQRTKGSVVTLPVVVSDASGSGGTYTITAISTAAGFGSIQPLTGVTVNPSTLTLPANGTATLQVTWDTSSLTTGDWQGYLVFSSGAVEVGHMPLWLRAVVLSPKDVLLIDNDGSATFGHPNFISFYTDALSAAGVTFDVWDADAHFSTSGTTTIPAAADLAAYKTVIWQTGDNYRGDAAVVQSIPATSADINKLTEFANNGGHLILFGQDAASVFAATGSNPPFLYPSTLGILYVQDTINGAAVSTTGVQLINGTGTAPFSSVSLDMSATGDGAGNLDWVDELRRSGTNDEWVDQVRPTFVYGDLTNALANGEVAFSRRDQPKLERPGSTFAGKTLYFGFGLEGLNSNTGHLTRSDLLKKSLDWLNDQVTLSVNGTFVATGAPSSFTATAGSTLGGATTFRWDFGDGTSFVSTGGTNTASHTYAAAGTFTVRVEATNTFGTRAVAAIVGTINPVPVLTSVAPSAVMTGSPQFTLTLTGSGFVPASVAKWNGVALATTYVSATQLTAIVPAANVAAAGSVDVTVVTPAPGGGTSSAVVVTVSDDVDGDGVLNTIEALAPNGGDGNGDAISDATQPGVASLTAAAGTGMITVVSTCPMTNVVAVRADSLPPYPGPAPTFPHGLVEFRIGCSAATLEILYHGGSSWPAGMRYGKYGPTAPGNAASTAWYWLPGVTFDTKTVLGTTVARARFSLTDGALGDDTGVDGVIVDQGGPAIPGAVIPTLSEWMLALLALALVSAGAIVLRIR